MISGLLELIIEILENIKKFILSNIRYERLWWYGIATVTLQKDLTEKKESLKRSE